MSDENLESQTTSSQQSPGGDTDESRWDPKTQQYVSSLRNEAKQRRLEAEQLRTRLSEVENAHKQLSTKLKSAIGAPPDEDDDMPPPEEIIGHMQAQLEDQAAELAFIRGASSMGIVDERDQRYLKFLLDEHTADKDEDYEIPQETLAEIISDVKSRSRAGNQHKPGTSFTQGAFPPPTGATGEVTVEQFKAMGITEKSQIYVNNPDLYNKLMHESTKKR